MPELLLKDEVYAIVGAAMDVYVTMGNGFLEPVYQEAMEIELGRRGIPFEAQKRLNLTYKNVLLTKYYKPDLVCYDSVLAELKMVSRLSGIEQLQLINYLKITKMHVGLLINFGSWPKLEWKRYVI